MNIKINNVIFIIFIRIAKLKVFWNLQRKLEFKQCFWISRLSWKTKVKVSVKQDMHSKLGLQLARSRISEYFSLEHFLWTFYLQLEHLILILLFFFKQTEQCFWGVRGSDWFFITFHFFISLSSSSILPMRMLAQINLMYVFKHEHVHTSV